MQIAFTTSGALRQVDCCYDDPSNMASDLVGIFSGTGITSSSLGTFDPTVYNFVDGNCSGSALLDVTVIECCPEPNCASLQMVRN